MISRRHFAIIAIILAILLVWTQQLVAAHGVVHPWHDNSSSKQAPGTHSQLCDLCVVSALDGAPALVFSGPVFAPVRHTIAVVTAVSYFSAPLFTYQSRAPPVLA
jgi:hypothetical protein